MDHARCLRDRIEKEFPTECLRGATSLALNKDFGPELAAHAGVVISWAAASRAGIWKDVEPDVTPSPTVWDASEPVDEKMSEAFTCICDCVEAVTGESPVIEFKGPISDAVLLEALAMLLPKLIEALTKALTK